MTSLEVAWLGHSTVDIRMGGTRIVTDPVLRDRVAHLRRHEGTADLDLGVGPVDAVLVSHLHHDHLDRPSLRRLPAGTPLVVPRGAGRLVARDATGEVVEVAIGDEVAIGSVTVTAVPAEHHGGRTLSRVSAPPLGFLVADGTRRAYFPGDTDLHPAMADLPDLDVALLPIWGWGPTLGPGHLDPERAARAAATLRCRSVLPVHWGTFAPVGVRRGPPAWLHRPASAFSDAMARHAPDVDLRLVRPGPDPVDFPE